MEIIEKDEIVEKNEIGVDDGRKKRYNIIFLKEDLEKYYIDEKKSILEISRIYGCSDNTIKSRLKKYRIPVRPNGAFLVDDDGESLYSKHNKGEITITEYHDELFKSRGYENVCGYNRKIRHERGIGTGLSMSENKECTKYLGVHICENKEFLSKIINIVESMPENNPGYDVVCIKDKKIDVKCSCLRKTDMWGFHICYNKTADYFLCISFDNREILNVQHIWLVKGDSVIEKTTAYLSEEYIVNEKDSISIGKGNRALRRWIKHEITDTYKLEEAQKLCDVFKKNRATL